MMNKHRFIIVGIVMILAYANVCIADGLYASKLFMEEASISYLLLNSSNIKRKPLEAVPKGLIKILEIEIERSSLSGILSRLGDAYLAKEHGESGSLGICYRSKKQSDNTVLFFDFGPSGGWRIVSGFSLIRDDTRSFDKCITSNIVGTDVKLDVGLRLGMDKSDVHKLLGTPSASYESWVGYIYEGKIKKQGVLFDVTTIVLIKMEKSGVVRIWVNKSTFS